MKLCLLLFICFLSACSIGDRSIASSEEENNTKDRRYGSKNMLDGPILAFTSRDLDSYLLDILPIALEDAYPGQQPQLINNDFLINFKEVQSNRYEPYKRVEYNYVCYRVRFMATRKDPHRKEDILETYLFVTTDLNSIKDLEYSLNRTLYTGNRFFNKTEATYEHHKEFPYAKASYKRFISLVGYPKKGTEGFCSNPGLGASSLKVYISKRKVRKNINKLEKFKKDFFRIID